MEACVCGRACAEQRLSAFNDEARAARCASGEAAGRYSRGCSIVDNNDVNVGKLKLAGCR